ncbi:hypothetical protein Tco_0282109 [Tanacetum coccineum]
MADEFSYTLQRFLKNLKLITDERVIKDNPESHSGSMSSMKNHPNDTDNFGDHFLYDTTKDDQENSKLQMRSDSTQSSTQPPTKDDEQSSKKPRESDAYASKQHPALTSTGWQITDTRDAVIWEDTITLTVIRQTGKKKLCKADLEGPAFNLVKAFHKNNVFLQYQMNECHKLLTNKVTIQPQFSFNKDLDYLLTGNKEQKIALSISKLKAVRYLDFRLEELVPSLWVETSDVKQSSQMRILSVISVKVYEKYGYNYLREIILRRDDYKEYKISEKDFKNLHPNDFEDLFLLNIQEKLNHLPKTDKTCLQLGLWCPRDSPFDLEAFSDSDYAGASLDRKSTIGEHPSETKVLHNEDGNPARANIKQALGSYERPHKGVKASANSDIVYFFTSAQDGDPLQDDVRLCLGDDLKKAQDHNQRQVKDESKDHYPKCTRYQMSTS